MPCWVEGHRAKSSFPFHGFASLFPSVVQTNHTFKNKLVLERVFGRTEEKKAMTQVVSGLINYIFLYCHSAESAKYVVIIMCILTASSCIPEDV